jgi:GTP-binding protein EngB required for normal cell division
MSSAGFAQFEELAAKVQSFAVAVQDLVHSEALLADDAVVARLASGLADAVREMAEGRFEIAVVGQVNVGKSTLLNALLFDKEVLPASPLPCTAKLTIIQHGESRRAKVKMLSKEEWADLTALAQRAQGRLTERDALTPEQFAFELVELARKRLGSSLEGYLGREFECSWEDLPKYVAAPSDDGTDDVGQFTGLTGEVYLTGPLPWGERAVIVDTPGISDPNPLREQVTREHLHKASAVLVLLNAAAPLSASDAQFLSHTLIPVGFSKIVVAINKMDNYDEVDRAKVTQYVREAMVRNVIAPLREAGVPRTLLDALAGMDPVPVSGLLALYARTKGCFRGADYKGPRLERKYGFQTYDEAWELSGAPEVERALANVVMRQDGVARVLLPLRKAIGVAEQCRSLLRRKCSDVAERSRNLSASRLELIQKLQELKLAAAKTKEAGARPARLVRDLVRRSTKEWATKVYDRVAQFIREVDTEADGIISGLSLTDVGSSERVTELNNELNWKLRTEFGDSILRDARMFLRDLGKETSDVLRDVLDGLLKDFGLTADMYVAERVRFASTLDVSGFEVSALPSFKDRPWYLKVFKPGQAREELRAEVRASLIEWQEGTRKVVDRFVADVERGFMEKYVEPAIAEVERAVQDRIRHIEDEMASREAASDDPSSRLEAIRLEREALETALAKVERVLKEGEAICAHIEGRGPESGSRTDAASMSA